MPISYISWAPHCSRSDQTARELGGTSHMIYWGRLGSRFSTVWLKYIGQTVDTWRVLAREQPDAVFVMTPPPIAIVAVYLACLVKRIPFVVDAHSAALQGTRWKLFQPLQFWLCRRAATTIVTHEHIAALIRSNGGRATIVPDVPIHYTPSRTKGDPDDFYVLCVTSHDVDEPTATMVEAARRLPGVKFYMTGNPKKAAERIGADPPPNLIVTGFIETSKFGDLMQRAGAVMALTTWDHTMQRGAWEAIYQGTPVIVSDFPILKEAFDEGAIHVPNSADAVVAAVEDLRANREEYRGGAARLRARKEARWQKTKQELLQAIGKD